ncbi:ABC transporter ATP-binding protein [Massilia sp. DWR3-1-1]|uniref:ABC transporter ATP-binding protein n=1 Tax=Massilia sp. DWR3-1-1 TaxID=2804559 RepID=UPI003CF325FD
MATADLHLVSQPLLRADGVTIDYRGERGASVRAVHQVSFALFRGERFVLLGPSGCGKSTLLKAVGGFITPSAGSLTLGGRPITKPGPDRIVVFQEFDQLPPWKTVKANVMFPMLAVGIERRQAERRALDWLARVGLAPFADAYPHTLSGGMKARVAIARALAMQPDILLMDEPFAALDALTRRQMQEQLQALWEEHRFTMLFVTHSIEEALVVGKRILLLSPHPGRVRAELGSGQFTLASSGSAPFQAAASRIHRLLFGAPPAGEPAAGTAATITTSGARALVP